MKKSLNIAACLLIAVCFALFCACEKDVSYREGVAEYIAGYKTVTCNVMENRYIELHVENTVTREKDEITDLFRILQADYSRLSDAFGLTTKIKCCVIPEEYVSDSDGAAYGNGILLCSENSVRSGGYRRALTAAYIRSTETWKQFGAYARAFGCEYDNEQLKLFYSDGNDEQLTLFAAYFMNEFSDDTETAEKTACSFGEFVLDNYGYDGFISADLTAYRSEYLKFLGVDRAFRIPFDLSWLDGAEYSRKTDEYPLVIKTRNRTYNLGAFSAKRDTASFDTPERVLYHLSAGNAECDKILNFIKNNAPGSYDFVYEKYSGNLEYFVSDREIKTCCDVDGGKIYLLDPSEYVHETVHAVTLAGNPTDEAWLGEGVAEYLSRCVSGHISDIHNRFYLSFTDETATGNNKDFVDAVSALYSDKGGKFDDLQSFDFALIEKCIGEITLKNGDFKRLIEFPYATTPIYKTYVNSSKDGNVLTYPEAYAFTGYLIEKYGFDKVISCCIRYDPKRAFGLTYDVLIEEYLSYIA